MDNCRRLGSALASCQVGRRTNGRLGEALGYRSPATRSRSLADVWSWGRDKVEGTDDDINSWELKRSLRGRRRAARTIPASPAP